MPVRWLIVAGGCIRVRSVADSRIGSYGPPEQTSRGSAGCCHPGVGGALSAGSWGHAVDSWPLRGLICLPTRDYTGPYIEYGGRYSRYAGGGYAHRCGRFGKRGLAS